MVKTWKSIKGKMKVERKHTYINGKKKKRE